MSAGIEAVSMSAGIEVVSMSAGIEVVFYECRDCGSWRGVQRL